MSGLLIRLLTTNAFLQTLVTWSWTARLHPSTTHDHQNGSVVDEPLCLVPIFSVVDHRSISWCTPEHRPRIMMISKPRDGPPRSYFLSWESMRPINVPQTTGKYTQYPLGATSDIKNQRASRIWRPNQGLIRKLHLSRHARFPPSSWIAGYSYNRWSSGSRDGPRCWALAKVDQSWCK